MKKILFVIPDLGNGGTNPSLEALYNHLKNDYSIKIFAIVNQPRSRSFLFDEVLLPHNQILSLLYADFNKLHSRDRLYAFVLKSSQRLLSLIHVDLKTIVRKRVVSKIEKNEAYDRVVAYQEGYATHFASHFHCNKTAWVHCNYDMWLPKEVSEEKLYSMFQYIVCVSDYTSKVFSSRYPSLRNRVLGIHNLLAPDIIISKGEQMIDDSLFDNSKFTIISVGRFHGVKRFKEIPKIASSIKQQNGDFRWYVIGDGYGTKELEFFQDNIEIQKVSDCVKYLGGKANPYPYFKAANVLVCTSLSEACPMIFIEAKILGIPIVTTDFPSAFEFVDNNINGCISPIEKISDDILKLMNNKSYYSHLKNGMAHFSYNQTDLIAKLQKVL